MSTQWSSSMLERWLAGHPHLPSVDSSRCPYWAPGQGQVWRVLCCWYRADGQWGWALAPLMARQQARAGDLMCPGLPHRRWTCPTTSWARSRQSWLTAQSSRTSTSGGNSQGLSEENCSGDGGAEASWSKWGPEAERWERKRVLGREYRTNTGSLFVSLLPQLFLNFLS